MVIELYFSSGPDSQPVKSNRIQGLMFEFQWQSSNIQALVESWTAAFKNRNIMEYKLWRSDELTIGVIRFELNAKFSSTSTNDRLCGAKSITVLHRGGTSKATYLKSYSKKYGKPILVYNMEEANDVQPSNQASQKEDENPYKDSNEDEQENNDENMVDSVVSMNQQEGKEYTALAVIHCEVKVERFNSFNSLFGQLEIVFSKYYEFVRQFFAKHQEATNRSLIKQRLDEWEGKFFKLVEEYEQKNATIEEEYAEKYSLAFVNKNIKLLLSRIETSVRFEDLNAKTVATMLSDSRWMYHMNKFKDEKSSETEKWRNSLHAADVLIKLIRIRGKIQ